MKVLIVSDTHGGHGNLDEAIEREEPFDMLLHLGDVEGGDDYINAIVECPVYIVKGNNDFFTDLPAEQEVKVEGHRIFMTHGHRYYVSMGEEHIVREARLRQADVVLYGHTHRPSIREKDGILIMNPGSLRYPRQEGRRPSYIVMDIARGQKVKAEVKYL